MYSDEIHYIEVLERSPTDALEDDAQDKPVTCDPISVF